MRATLVFCFLALAAPAGAADFDRDVRPILAKHCVRCHGDEKQSSELRLDSVAATREGGNAGPAVVPGKSGDSLLIKAVIGAKGAPAMPPRGKRLSDQDVAV